MLRWGFFFILKNSLFSFSLNEKLFYSPFTHLYFLSFTFSLISCQTLYRLKTRSNDHRSKLDFKFSDMTFKEFSTYFLFFFLDCILSGHAVNSIKCAKRQNLNICFVLMCVCLRYAFWLNITYHYIPTPSHF